MCFIDEGASTDISILNAVPAAGFVPMPPNLKYVVQGGPVHTLPSVPNQAVMCSMKCFCAPGGITRMIDPKINLTNPMLSMLGPGLYPMPCQPVPNIMILS